MLLPMFWTAVRILGPQVARTTNVALGLGELLPLRFPLWAGPPPCTSCLAMLLCGIIVPLEPSEISYMISPTLV